MKHLKLGSSDLNASVIGLGAWAIGGGSFWGADSDDAESIRTIHAALDNGITLIDTAPAYGFGRSEKVLARALKGRRDKVLIATKCGLWWEDSRGSNFFEIDGKRLSRSLRPDTIAIEVERSLSRLETDCIDLYQTHWPSMEPDKTPIEDTVAELTRLKDQGKIRTFGVSNVSPQELEENVRCGDVVSNQFRYSMLYREPEKDILPLCKKHGLSTLTYMSLEQGLLTGKVGPDTGFKEGEFRNNEAWNPWYLPDNRRRVLDFLERIKPRCAAHDCTLAQLVLAWTLARDGVTHVLAGARKVKHIEETARAADLKLSAEDIAVIDAGLKDLGEPVVKKT